MMLQCEVWHTQQHSQIQYSHVHRPLIVVLIGGVQGFRLQTVTTKTDESVIDWWEELGVMNSNHRTELTWRFEYKELMGTYRT